MSQLKEFKKMLNMKLMNPVDIYQIIIAQIRKILVIRQ